MRVDRAVRHGELAVQNATGVLFAEAAEEWIRDIEFDRERKPGTVKGYRWILNSQLLPAFGSMPVESLTTEMIEAWLAGLGGTASSRGKVLVLLHGILKRARLKFGLKLNAAVDVEKPPLRRSGDIQVYSPEEVWGWCARRRPSSMPRSSSPRRSPGCGWGSCSPCAGVRSTSPGRSCGCARATTPAR